MFMGMYIDQWIFLFIAIVGSILTIIGFVKGYYTECEEGE